jgi:hypothetical protein
MAPVFEGSLYGSVFHLSFIHAGSPCRHPPSILNRFNVSPPCTPSKGSLSIQGVDFHS